jgi:hypothetical protein
MLVSSNLKVNTDLNVVRQKSTLLIDKDLKVNNDDNAMASGEHGRELSWSS